jgi:hypothetical protein
MTTTTLITTGSPRPSLGRRLAAVLERARTQRADRSDLARQIAAYPAARSVAPVVLPLAHR